MRPSPRTSPSSLVRILLHSNGATSHTARSFCLQTNSAAAAAQPNCSWLSTAAVSVMAVPVTLVTPSWAITPCDV
jgi:hypothetical protein